MTAKICGQGIDEDFEGWLVVQAAGLSEREYPFHPATALVGVAAEAAFAPEYGEKRMVRSATLLVGWTPASWRKTKRHSISLSSRRTSLPASLSEFR
jgi:hypothetical protein